MKILHLGLWLIFLAIYAVFHFGYRTDGDAQLYKINDRIAFELHEANEYTNGVAVRGYRPTNAFVKFFCGACQIDTSSVDMVNAKYRSGDYVFSDFPQHDKCPTDIFNLKTGEAINVQPPADFKFNDDLSKLAEYRERGLFADEKFRLNQDYIKANFEHLSTFTERCIWIHLIFAVVALFLAFPKLIIYCLEAIFTSNNPHDPSNYLRP